MNILDIKYPLIMFPKQMPSYRKRLLLLFTCFFLGLVSCATERNPAGVFQTTSLEGRHSTVAICVRPYAPNINADSPIAGAGKGALTGAGMAGGAWSAGLAGASDPYAAILFVALLPVAVVTGAITGAVTAHPEEEVIKATTAIKAALLDARPVEGMQDAIKMSLIDLYDDRVRIRLLSESEMNISSDQLATLDLDAVLDVEISYLDLGVYGKIDPDASLTMAVRASIILTDTKVTTAPSTWTYLGKRHDYFELAEDDAQLLREKIKNAYKNIANVLVADYFY